MMSILRFHAIGLGFCTSWMWLFFLQGPLLEQTASAWGAQAETLFLLFLLFHSLSCGSIGLFKLRSLITFPAILTPTALFMSLAPLVLYVIPEWFPKIVSSFSWLVYIIAALSGIVAAYLFVAWAERFGKLSITAAAMALAYSLCIAGLLTIASAHFDPLSGFVLLFLLPMLSLVCIKQVDRTSPQATIEQSDIPIYRVFPWRLILLIALLYIAGGLMFKTITMEQTFPYFFYLSNLAYMLVCLIASLSLKYYPSLDLRLLYRPVLPLVGVGFLLFPLLSGPLASLSFFFLQAGLALFDVYTWLLIAYLSRRHARPAAVCGFGLSLITFSIFGGDLAFNVVTMFSNTIARLDYLSFGAGIVCLFASQFFPADRETFAGWHTKTVLPVEADSDNTSGESNPMISEKFHLDGPIVFTPREQDVLSLLIKGWNNPSIAEKLNISNNTVKFHIRNIYEKCNVNSRQELVKLFDN
jgi:DNA-binding CsgD family transcriptional regulator